MGEVLEEEVFQLLMLQAVVVLVVIEKVKVLLLLGQQVP